jgi:hypothetical protein
MPRMKNFAFAIVFVVMSSVLASLAACHKSSAPPPEPTGSGAPAGDEEAAGEGGGGAAAGSTTSCKSDDDCVVSCARPSECCDQLCPPCAQVFNKDGLAALDAWKSQNCAAVSCPVAKCMAPKEQTVARCTAGTCTIERVPAAN